MKKNLLRSISHGRACFSAMFYLLVLAVTLQVGNANALDVAVEGINGGATYTGQAVCGQCHSLEDKHFAGTMHAKVFANPKSTLQAKVCEACHGPGSNHVADPSNHNMLIGFTREWGAPINVQQGQCLQCHDGGQRIYWEGSIHQKNRLSCSDCHNPMARFSQSGLMKKPSIIETCFTCHKEKRAEFSRRSHMPLLEGKMSCDDCHNPHGSRTRTLLKGDTIAETCFQCHAEKRGPFLWEHPPVRQGDQCLNCHLPHGSNQEKLLIVGRPQLCYQCHGAEGIHLVAQMGPLSLPSNNGTQNAGGALTPNFNTGVAGTAFNSTGMDPKLTGRSCNDCHTEIHGSNSTAGARWHR